MQYIYNTQWTVIVSQEWFPEIYSEYGDYNKSDILCT